MEKAVITRHGAVRDFLLHVFQEGCEAADDFLMVQFFSNGAKVFRRHAQGSCPAFPWFFGDFFIEEFFLEHEQDSPFLRSEGGVTGFFHGGGFGSLVSGFETAASHVTYAQGKDAAGG